MTAAVSLPDLFPGLAAQAVPLKYRLEPEVSWLAVLLAALPVEWFTPAPPATKPATEDGEDGEKERVAPPDQKATGNPAALPWGIEVVKPDPVPNLPPPAETPEPHGQLPVASGQGPATPPPPPHPEAFRLEAKWQPEARPAPTPPPPSLPIPAAPPTVVEKKIPVRQPAAVAPLPPPRVRPPFEPEPYTAPAPKMPVVAVEAPTKPSAPERPRSEPAAEVAPAPPEPAKATPQPEAGKPVERPEQDPDPAPAVRRSPAPAPRQSPRWTAEVAEVAEAAPPAAESKAPARPLPSSRPSEAPAPEPVSARAAVEGSPKPQPSPQPAQLHGLERAIERAELRQSSGSSEINLWMRPEHLGKVAVRLVERAGVVEVAVRAETSSARGWLAEGLPTLVDGLRERGFEINHALRGAETGLDWWAQDRQGGKQQQPHDGQKRRGRETAVFSLEPGEPS